MTRIEALQAQVDALHERLWRLSEAGVRINESMEFESVLQAVVDSACELTDARFGAIAVIDRSGSFERFVSSGMTTEEHRLLSEMPERLTLAEHFRRLDASLRVNSIADYFRSNGLPDFSPPFEVGPCLVMPIRSNRAMVGSIYVARAPRSPGFADQDEMTLATFASQVATVLASARRYRDERRARADLESLLDTSPVGMLVFDAARGTAARANLEALRIVNGLHGPDESAADLLSLMTVRRADGRETSLAETPLAQALSAGETVRAERVVFTRPGWPPRTVLINATPTFDESGKVESVFVTMQDMTPLEDLDWARAEFLDLVSEELRSPLLALKGSAATLLESLAVLDSDEAAQLVRGINAQANRMRALIAELLDIARIESGTLAPVLEPTDGNHLVEEARHLFASTNHNGDVTIDTESDLPTVMADQRRILQVLQKTVSVASRFADGAAPVRVRATHDSRHLRFSVTGPGPCVPAESLGSMLRARSRLDLDERTAGMDAPALTLAICRGIVESHGGRLEAHNDNAGSETRYEFTLPLPQAGAAPTQPRRFDAVPRANAAIRILVIDDDPLTQRHVNGALTRAGYQVNSASEVQQALQLAALHNPDLVLAGLGDPGADGTAILRALRDEYEAPVILLTGYGQDEAMPAALQAGAADYIVKPFSPTELDARIRTALRQHADPAPAPAAEPFTLGELTIDYVARAVTLAGEPVPLTRTEYQLLAELSRNAGCVLSHDHLIERVWRSTSPAPAGIIRSAVKRLRRKLGDDAAEPNYIITVPGMGYRVGAPPRRTT